MLGNLRWINLVLNRDVDRYATLGLGLIVFGVPFAIFSYLILLNTPLTSLGLACIIMGATVTLTPSNPVPKHAVRAMVEGSCLNIEALLEEFDVYNKAVYLPPRDGRVYAYVPLTSNIETSTAWAALESPLRVFTKTAGKPGLLVFPPGSEIVRLSLINPGSGVEEALSRVLVDSLEAVNSVKAIRDGEQVVIKMTGVRVETDFPRFTQVLGCLPTSTAGCVLSTVIGVPALLSEEEIEDDEVHCVFRLVPKIG